MKNVPENELLSAYLDGELTAEEQAQIERLLAANPEARQLVDELRALSSSVKALPSHKIGRDISEEVLSRAKRQMPAQPTSAQPMPARPGEQETPEAEAPLWRAIVRRVARPRNFVWSGVAVAVVVLLMVMKSDTLMEPRGSVAMKAASDADEPAATASPPPSMQAVGEAEEGMFAEAPPAAEMPAGEPPPGPVELAESEAREREAPMAAVRRAPLATAPSAAPTAAPPAAIEQPAKAPARPGRTADGYGRGFGGMAGQAEVADDRGRPEAPRVAKRGAFKGQPSVTGKKAKAGESGLAVESAPAKTGQRRRGGVQQPDVLLVVSCDVTAEALRENVFKELLDRHEMTGAMTGAVAGGRLLGRISAGEPIAPADEPDVRVVVGKPFEVVEVDVEATPNQIKALLADLQERPGQFSSLSYALDPAAVSRGLGRFWANGQVSAQRQAGTALDEDVQTVGEPAAAEAARQKVSRTDVDKVLELARRFRYGPQLGQKAEAGATFGVEAQPAARPPEKEGRAATAIPQPEADRDHERAEPKLRASLAGPGAGAARPAATGAYGAPMQSATPAEPATPAETPAPPPADAFQPEMKQPSKSQADRPQPERPQPKRRLEWEQIEEEQEPPKSKAAADRVEMARPVPRLEAKQAEARGGAEAQQMPEREPAEARPPGLPAEADRLDRDSGRYRVRFVLRVVRPQRGNVAASVAKDAPMIDMASETARTAAEASPAEMAPPRASAAQAAEVEP
ncbi:MAG TPA: zf-HC2 domain-containing protein [Thermoguttaceae bacterium]|nr:zf-HC2 domain-containing protein [Thermoguttaceae bacterium]